MSNEVIHIKSISELHRALGLEPPQHPLITLIDVQSVNLPEMDPDQRMIADYYMISMKDGNCGMQYGRNYYDFEEGVLVFTAPNQVISGGGENTVTKGWMLFFHPDLIRGSNLGANMSKYSFFSYDVHEALHLSQKEQNMMDSMVERIEYEYQQNIDGHTQDLLVSHLELVLNYSLRFYERQFHTRKKQNVDVLTKVETLLTGYYKQEKQFDHGVPSIHYLAENVHLSPNYLSDLLKKETGRNAKDHISHFVVERAKNQLLNTNDAVGEIAYNLGFNYPHYFSRMFKQRTGLTPQKYRERSMN